MKYNSRVLFSVIFFVGLFFFGININQVLAVKSGGSPAGIVWNGNATATQWAAGWLSGSGLVGKYKNECGDGVDNNGNTCFLWVVSNNGNRWFGAGKGDTRWCRYITKVTDWGGCSVSGIQYATSYSYNTIYGTTICSDQVQSWQNCIPDCIPNRICGSADTICKNEICDTGCNRVIGSKDCGPYCGDGILNGVEQCDAAASNGMVCTPVYGGNCSYCNDICRSVSLAGGYCGDSVQNGSEQCDGSTSKANAHCDNCQNVCNDGFHEVNGSCVCEDTPDCNQDDICAGESRNCCVAGVRQGVVGKKDCRDMNWKEVSPN